MALIDRITGQSALQQEIAGTFERMSELKSLVCPTFDLVVLCHVDMLQLSVSSEFEEEEIREEAERLCEEVIVAGIGPGEERHLRYALQVLETHASSVEAAVGIGSSLDGEILLKTQPKDGNLSVHGYSPGGSEGIIHALQDVTSRIKSIARQEQRNAGGR